MKTRKITALLLCLLLVASCLLVACDKGGDDTSSGSTGTTSTGNNSGTTDSKYLDDNGRYWPSYSDSMRESLIGDRTEFRVLVYDDTTQKTYYSEEIEPGKYTTSDAKLTEAVTERNNLVSEELGIDVKAVYTDDVTTMMRQEMLAPSGTFDAAMPFLSGCALLAQEGALYDLREFEEQGIIDLSAPWYDQNANESLSIQNKIYFTVSDMSIMQKVVSIAMTYNPDLLATKYPDLDLLELVNNGEWTFDKLYEIGREFADDTNGDGTMDYNDTWGLVSATGDAVHFYIGAGEKLCTKDENDNPILAIGSTNSISVSQKILSTLQSNNWVSFAQDLTSQGVAASDIWDVTLSIFGEGRAPFRVTAFSAIKKLRAYDIDYGIVPMPMVEESQDSYYTNCAALYAYGVVVPNFLSEDDAKFAAYMIDVLSAGGKQYIATAYYDQILKNKDALDVEVLDMIFENIVYDVGIVYGFEGLGNIHTTLMTNKSTDIVSQLDTIRDAVNAKIEEVIEKYSK